jgi:hypothetical protein
MPRVFGVLETHGGIDGHCRALTGFDGLVSIEQIFYPSFWKQAHDPAGDFPSQTEDLAGSEVWV